jgi:diaminohydroxyphosphoribosylaminopyrimidine deaminase/5-amino-6-(5-phosphoribosylamino)uracil reductase
VADASRCGRVAIPSLLDALANRGLTSILVEGGATVHGAFLDGKHYQRVMVYIAPVLIGGKDAPSPIAGIGIASMENALRLKEIETTFINPDLFLTGLIQS